MIREAARELLGKMTPYDAGWDCALNGSNEVNCDFRIFSSRANTHEWERGKRNAEAWRREAF